MADRFYTPEPLSLGEFTLEGPEAHHLATVLRAKPGQEIVLFNGNGYEYRSEVLSVDKRAVLVNILNSSTPPREREHALTIAASMPKGDRGDWMIEKLAELGVTAFVPLITERTVVIPKDSRIDNLRRSVIEASKQCGRNMLMQIEEPVKWPTFASRSDLPDCKVILDPTGTQTLKTLNQAAVIAIGPEGGFTVVELAMPGWQAASCGPRILRIETAAIFAACVSGIA